MRLWSDQTRRASTVIRSRRPTTPLLRPTPTAVRICRSIPSLLDVLTCSYPLPARSPSSTTWHTVFSFNPGANNYIRTLQKGQRVYVEANYELRDADRSAEPSSPQGQRQIFLRHGESPSFSALVPRPNTAYATRNSPDIGRQADCPH
jgi:hypothetical protein